MIDLRQIDDRKRLRAIGTKFLKFPDGVARTLFMSLWHWEKLDVVASNGWSLESLQDCAIRRAQDDPSGYGFEDDVTVATARMIAAAYYVYYLENGPDKVTIDTRTLTAARKLGKLESRLILYPDGVMRLVALSKWHWEKIEGMNDTFWNQDFILESVVNGADPSSEFYEQIISDDTAMMIKICHDAWMRSTTGHANDNRPMECGSQSKLDSLFERR